jgi:glycosyltransferase involved in cell wall biosynthesis
VRILFVLGTSTGGAAKSTHALATALARRGHEVAVLERDKTQPRVEYLYKRLTNAREHRRGQLGERLLDGAARCVGRKRTLIRRDYPTWRAVHVENALPKAIAEARPEIVVSASISRLGWVSVQRQCARAAIPSVLYIREAVALSHLEQGRPLPDLLLANAEGHAGEARERGLPCRFVPSLVDVSATKVTTTRQVALLVNPRKEHGVDVALDLARRRSDVAFALHESWLLSDSERAYVEDQMRALPNVELRPFTSDNRDVYRDARIVLAPHTMDNRPRVVLEAQSNGIPVLATEWPGLREAVGPGGILLPTSATADDWAQAFSVAWDDAATYDALSAAAAQHAARDEVQPEVVLSTFERCLTDVLSGAVEADVR